MVTEKKKIVVDEFVLEAQAKQKIWREKQINILYKYGRPIFGRYDEIDDKIINHPPCIWRFYKN